MLTRRQTLSLFAAAPVALAATRAAAAEPMVFQRRGAAINGYDPVAYFTEKRPVEGSSEFTSEWKGATFRFASAANKATFDGDPERYAPQYGGYCAWAVSRGYTAKTEPEAWTIHDGKLYLNFSLGVRRRWERDVPGNVAKGDANWPSVLG